MFAALAGVAAGLVHVVFGPDHLAAVAPLAASRERQPWRTGLQWGLGHTAGVLLVGLLLTAFRAVLPIEAISQYSERIVGIALLGLGVWGVGRARSARVHSHTSTRASFLMGALHGVAGSSHLFGVLPALAFPSQTAALWYLAGFGAGAILAMTVFAAVIGTIALGASRRGVDVHRGMLYACSACAFLVGGFWLVV